MSYITFKSKLILWTNDLISPLLASFSCKNSFQELKSPANFC
ncbi:hypothetical protein SAMN05444420_10764 [Capnocytophaga granulosa]|uniref:Uncharacterized protein n=1 Tax=Capnocytophaga granulosa TaxID=45242 RepID=A0A1H2YJP1_9FLAO|nr:hypothetical protein HMPREF9331_02187 [Capnocytophaga granulosa ATCC 51502]SDX05195.1 hypothetical protein SAMN05444420_10764 [Capnocytophaga granulosa]